MGKFKLSEVLKKPWTHLIVDFIMKLPLVSDMKSLDATFFI